MKTPKKYAVTFVLTNEFGMKTFHVPIEANDPDEVCALIAEQNRCIVPRPDIKIVSIVEDFAGVE